MFNLIWELRVEDLRIWDLIWFDFIFDSMDFILFNLILTLILIWFGLIETKIWKKCYISKKSGSQGDGPSISIWPPEHNSFLPIVRDPVRKNQFYSLAKSWIGFWAFEFWLAQYKVYVPSRFNWNFSFIRCQKSRNFRVNRTYWCPTSLWISIFQRYDYKFKIQYWGRSQTTWKLKFFSYLPTPSCKQSLWTPPNMKLSRERWCFVFFEVLEIWLIVLTHFFESTWLFSWTNSKQFSSISNKTKSHPSVKILFTHQL